MTKGKTQKTKLPHGGDWAGYIEEYGRDPLDFSMNVNPLGISAQVRDAIAEAAASADRYPDPLCRDLIQRLAGAEGAAAERIFCGNGAADIIFRLAQALKPEKQRDDDPKPSVEETAPDKEREGLRPVLLITAPTFSEYETAFSEYGWEIRRHLLKKEDGFQITEVFLAEIGEDTDAVFLCEPNNPTGLVTDRKLLEKILQRCRQTGTWLIVDECFNGFLDDPDGHSLKRELNPAAAGPDCDRRAGAGDCAGLIILKAFTKLYGMAGVRLGYCLCEDEETVSRIRRAGPPWNVSSLAQAAGIAALDAEDHVAKGLKIVHEERRWLREQLHRLGIEGIYGEANYLLFYADTRGTGARGDTQAGGLDQRLRKRGILIRNCENYPGLGTGWFRIAVRTRQENEQLVRAMAAELD